MAKFADELADNRPEPVAKFADVPYTVTDNRTESVDELTDNRPEPVGELNFKATCIELFNTPFKLYKQVLNQDKDTKNIYGVVLDDHLIFQDIQNGMSIIVGMIKYAIFSSEDMWTSKSPLPSDISVKFPADIEKLTLLFKIYPWTIDYLNPEIFNIITLENFEMITMLSKINPNLYFSTFVEEEDAEPIKMCKDDVVAMWVNIKSVVKKLMKRHIQIAKMKD